MARDIWATADLRLAMTRCMLWNACLTLSSVGSHAYSEYNARVLAMRFCALRWWRSRYDMLESIFFRMARVTSGTGS